MRLQVLLLSIAVVVLVEEQYSAESPPTASSTTTPPTTPAGWDWTKNYLDSNEDLYMTRKRPSYRNRKNYPSNNKKPYKGNYDDEYERPSSYTGSNEYENDNNYANDNDDGYPYDNDDDYTPTKYDGPKKPDSLGHMNVYFREPSKDGRRKKPKRFRFPVARYERNRFPRSFGPLISFLPWLPIFADRLTKQTIIYSPAGGVYILPPLINFYGKRFSVAELIASGYASLVSSGAPPPPAVNVAPLVQPGAVVGPGVPTINPGTGGFEGGVRTQFHSFPRPNYPPNIEAQAPYSSQTNYDKPPTSY